MTVRPSRLVRATALAALVAASLTACSSGSSTSSTSTGSEAAPGPEALGSAPVKVSFWHSMTGKNADALNAMVAAFNTQSAGKVVVEPVFQGNYDDSIAKYKASVQQKGTPALIQVYDIGTRFMIDSKQTIPAAAFVKKDGFPVGDLEPNIVNYYSTGGTLQSMPFNSSMPLLYLNADAFTKAGLDPTKPPRTLDELTEAAKRLTVKDAGGQTVQYGFGAAIYGWFLEQLVAQSGTQYCTQDNGRKGLADKVLFDSPQGAQVAQWWAQLVKDGYAVNTGKKTDDAQAAFKAGRVAMNLESTGALGGYQAAAQGKFTLGTAPFPKITAGDTGGPVIGGASLWIDKVGHSTAEQRGAWEFAKFASSPATQATWHTATGYFPVNARSLDEPADKAWVAKYPQFNVAIEQLHGTRASTASAGCLLGVMPQARKAAENGLEKAILGQAAPQAALTEAAGTVTPLIAGYNSSVK